MRSLMRQEESRRPTMAVIGALVSVLSLAGWLGPVGVAEADDAVLVQIIDTSLFVPPSPDPAGIAYLDFSLSPRGWCLPRAWTGRMIRR